MKACTFFGHRDADSGVISTLRSTIEDLILNHRVDTFYIGNQGNFDFYAKKVVCELATKYGHIRYAVVLAYRPDNSTKEKYFDFSDTIIPEEVATAHPRYSIVVRNKWMIEHSDYVISYITHDFGGAAKAIDLCRKKNKRIINVASTRHTNF